MTRLGLTMTDDDGEVSLAELNRCNTGGCAKLIRDLLADNNKNRRHLVLMRMCYEWLLSSAHFCALKTCLHAWLSQLNGNQWINGDNTFMMRSLRKSICYCRIHLLRDWFVERMHCEWLLQEEYYIGKPTRYYWARGVNVNKRAGYVYSMQCWLQWGTYKDWRRRRETVKQR